MDLSTREKVKGDIDNNDLKEAKQRLIYYLKDHNNDGEVAILAATISIIESNIKEAKDIITEGLRLESDNYELYFILGNCYEIEQQYDLAYLCYMQSIFKCLVTSDKDFISNYLDNFVTQNEIHVNDTTIILLRQGYHKISEECKNAMTQNLGVNDVSYLEIYPNESFSVAWNHKILPYLNHDILIMNESDIMLPNTLFHMKMALYRKKTIGAVDNGNSVFENNAYGVYSEKSYCRVVGFMGNLFLLKKELVKKIGMLEEQLYLPQANIINLGIHVIQNDYSIYRCNNAFTKSVFVIKEQDMDKVSVLLEEDNSYLREKWGMNYFVTTPNQFLIQLIDKKPNETFSVLEIGCDCGATLVEIKNQYSNANVFGIEINKSSASIASKFFDVKISNIEEENLDYIEKFDYIIFGDVLEHLHDPEQVLKKMRNHLKVNGKIISSIPNVMHISIVKGLLHGEWTYTDTGLLDRTHIHLFTAKEIWKMFQNAGYKLKEFRHINCKLTKDEEVLLDKLLELDCETPRFMYEAYQYVILAEIIF